MRARAIDSDTVGKPKRKATMYCVFCYENEKGTLGLSGQSKKIKDAILQSVKENKGKKNSIAIIHSHNDGPYERILIAGLGKKNKMTFDVLRDVVGNITKKVHELGIDEFTISTPRWSQDNYGQTVSAIVEGANLSLYDFDLYKKEKSNKKSRKNYDRGMICK